MDIHAIAAAIRALRNETRPCSSMTLETRDANGSRYTFLTHGGGGVRKLREIQPREGARYWLHAVSQKRRISRHTEITRWLASAN